MPVAGVGINPLFRCGSGRGAFVANIGAPAAAKSCANCTAGTTYFYDQSNIPDSNFWALSGSTAASKGTPPLYTTSLNTASTNLTATFTQITAITMASFQADWRLVYSAKGVVGGVRMVRRIFQYGTGTNGRLAIDMSVIFSSPNFVRRINILNDSAGSLYFQDTVIGASPVTAALSTGTIKVVQTDIVLKTLDVYLDGVAVVTGYIPTLGAAQKAIMNTGWNDSNYPAGANSDQGEIRVGNIYMTAAAGYPYACCG